MSRVHFNNKEIEKWGVEAVDALLSQADTLDSYLSANDKTPVWDGYVIIYKSTKWSNENIIGRVSVQIKGKLITEPHLSEEEISYSVKTVDLNIYKKNNGTIFFVTLINRNNTLIKTVYYETLTPIKIRNYIKGKENQATCTIKLKRLSHSNHEIQTIFYNFYKESSLGDIEPISLDKLLSINDNVKITGNVFQFIPDGEKTSPIDVILNNELLWIAEFSNHPTPIPIDLGGKTKLSIIQKERLSPIIVNGEKYENYYSIERNKNSTIYNFGKSITLEIPKKLNRINIKYTSPDLLSDRIRDFNFFINLIETNEINFEGEKPLILGEIKSDKPFELEEAKIELDFYKRVDDFWKSLKANDDFDIGNIETNSSLKELDILMESMNGKKPIHIATLGKEQYYLLKKAISNFKILFILEAVDQEKSLYKIYNFFDYSGNFYGFINNTHFITSKHSALKCDDYIELSNIDFSDILSSYKELIKFNDYVLILANNNLLELLSAYDKHEVPPSIILETAKEIAVWLLEEGDNEVVDYEIRLINFIQTKKRERPLSEEDNKELYEISEKSDNLMYKIGANLLLENYKVAHFQFEKLSDKEKALFRLFPIYHFWEQN